MARLGRGSPFHSLGRTIVLSLDISHMPATLRPVGLNLTIDAELEAMESTIDTHQRALHKEGIWLFLAVLGCWSVYPEWLRLCALMLAVFIFFHSYEAYRTDKRDFRRQFAAARARISALVIDQRLKQDGLDRLAILESQRLSGLRPLYAVPGFVVGWFSFGATLIITVVAIVRKFGAS